MSDKAQCYYYAALSAILLIITIIELVVLS